MMWFSVSQDIADLPSLKKNTQKSPKQYFRDLVVSFHIQISNDHISVFLLLVLTNPKAGQMRRWDGTRGSDTPATSARTTMVDV